jgi:hypothetical protein
MPHYTPEPWSYRFDSGLYNDFDAPAKLAVSGCLTARGLTVYENPCLTGIDLLCSRSGEQVAAVECEVRRAWRSGPWRFPTVETSIRKRKYFAPSGHWLAVVRADLGAALLVPLTGSPPVVAKEVGRGFGERFYSFPTGSAVRLGLG